MWGRNDRYGRGISWITGNTGSPVYYADSDSVTAPASKWTGS